MKRYVLEADRFEIKEVFGVSSDSDSMYEPNYNVMPGHTMPIIIQDEGKNTLISSTWGLKKKGEEKSLPELPQEDVLEDETWTKMVEMTPCIIPASGFYKWKETVDDPLPFYLRVITQDVAGYAGIFNSYQKEDGHQVHSFAMITMKANALVEPVDNRMPVILQAQEYEPWLAGKGVPMIEKGFSGDLLLPDMSVVRVPELVNDPSNNSKELIQPIPKLRNYDGPDDD